MGPIEFILIGLALGCAGVITSIHPRTEWQSFSVIVSSVGLLFICGAMIHLVPDDVEVTEPTESKAEYIERASQVWEAMDADGRIDYKLPPIK